jgi:hypothetical protein
MVSPATRRRTEMPDIPEIGEELFLFLQTLGQMQPGENGALAFAKTLSGATPGSFAEALERTSVLLFLALREEGRWSARKARRYCDSFEATARGEYSRLRNASGKTKAGTG